MKFLEILFLAICFQGFAQIPEKPNPPKAYNDYSSKKLLNYAEEQSIEKELKDFEKSTSNAIVVVVVDDLKNLEIADYGDKLGEAWCG